MWIAVSRGSSGRNQRAELSDTRQPKRCIGRTRGRLWWHVVEVQDERRAIALAHPCSAHLALCAPDIPLCLLECRTGRVVVLVVWVVYPTTFLPQFPALFPVEHVICFFLGFPLILSAPRIVTWELAHNCA
jgi:hypothetical protein